MCRLWENHKIYISLYLATRLPKRSTNCRVNSFHRYLKWFIFKFTCSKFLPRNKIGGTKRPPVTGHVCNTPCWVGLRTFFTTFLDSKSILRSLSKTYFYGEKYKCVVMRYFPVQSYFSTKFNTKMQKNYTQKNAENSSPTGGFDLGFEKSYFCRLLWEKLKKRRRRKFS